eukprot:TRINITY_DN8599_c0_g1_i1.p1 TRINITY_DN8599_c0_g1~~TRINITY_DN8599_c0_g1_i1.p1  ORF type:complete len:154 (-),score=28.69 TRINITY_DN8599_c0_g1_i1:13-474(-)
MIPVNVSGTSVVYVLINPVNLSGTLSRDGEGGDGVHALETLVWLTVTASKFPTFDSHRSRQGKVAPGCLTAMQREDKAQGEEKVSTQENTMTEEKMDAAKGLICCCFLRLASCILMVVCCQNQALLLLPSLEQVSQRPFPLIYFSCESPCTLR